MLIKKENVRAFIQERAPDISKVESAFYGVLDAELRKLILKAIRRNGKHSRLTTGELLNLQKEELET